MRERIARHRKERGDSFLTIEAPIGLAGAVQSLPANIEAAVVDCLTMWLGNLMHQGARERPETEALFQVLRKPRCNLIVVSNEVGMGIVPDNPMARRFRDLAGQLNQDVARLAERVDFMVSGIAMTVKGETRDRRAPSDH